MRECKWKLNNSAEIGRKGFWGEIENHRLILPFGENLFMQNMPFCSLSPVNYRIHTRIGRKNKEDLLQYVKRTTSPSYLTNNMHHAFWYHVSILILVCF